MGKKSNNNLNQLIKEFEEYLLIAGRSKNTIDAYTRTVKQTLSSKNLDTLSQRDLNKIALHLIKRYQVNANRMRYAAINLFCKEILHRKDLYLKIPKPKRKNRDVLTYEQVIGLLKVAKRKRKVVYAFIQVLFRCALRKGELCNLNIEDVNFETMEIYLRDTKTGDGIVILHTIAAEAIKDYIEHERIPVTKGEKALFLSKRGKRIGERFVRDNLKQCAVEAGITRRVYPHMLRASSITHMLNVGTNPLTVQTQARHNSFKQTMTYNRPTQQQMREGIEKAFSIKTESNEKESEKDINKNLKMNEEEIKLILLKKYVEGEITLEKYDKLMEVMQPKQLKPVTELAGYI